MTGILQLEDTALFIKASVELFFINLRCSTYVYNHKGFYTFVKLSHYANLTHA